MHIAWVGIAVIQISVDKKASYDKKQQSEHNISPHAIGKGRYNN